MPEPNTEAWAQIRYDYEHTDRPVEDICAEHGISSGTLRDRIRRWRWTRRRSPISRDGPPPVAMAQRDIASPSPVRAASVARMERSEMRESMCTDPGFRHRAGHLGPDPLAPSGLQVADHPTPTVFADAQTVDTPPPGEGDDRAAVPHAATGVNAQSDPASIAQRLQGAVARVLPAIEANITRLAAGPQHPREMEQAGRALSSLTRTLRELNTLLSQHNTQAVPYDDMPEDMDAFREALARRIEAFMEARGDDAFEYDCPDEAKRGET